MYMKAENYIWATSKIKAFQNDYLSCCFMVSQCGVQRTKLQTTHVNILIISNYLMAYLKCISLI